MSLRSHLVCLHVMALPLMGLHLMALHWMCFPATYLTTHQLQKYSHSTSIQKCSHSTRNIYLRFLRLFGILLLIRVVGFVVIPSIVPLFTTISTPHIVALATHFNALIWLLINSYFPLFFGPPALFPWLRWFYRFHTLINRPLIRAKHRINPGGIGFSVCIHHVPMANISLRFSFIEVYRTNCMWARNSIKFRVGNF
jgi:hypothetical protein